MGFLGIVFWIVAALSALWVIYDIVAVQKDMKDNPRLIWIICAILFSIITAIAYYIVVKQK